MTSHVEAERLARLADGLIDPADEQELRAHIDQCESCFEAWAQEFLPLLTEGLLDATDEQALREHLAVCSQCSATWAEYSEAISAVPELLAEARYPPLTEETAGSLQALLRAESDLATAGIDSTSKTLGSVSDTESAYSNSEADAAPAGALLPLHSRATRKRATRWMPYLVAAAAAVFLLGGGAAVFQATLGTDSPAGLNDSAHQDEADSEDEAPEAVLPAQPRLVASGTEYTTNLDAAAAEVLSQARGTPDDGEETTQTENELPAPEPEEAPEDEAIVACVEAMETTAPLVVDVASYAGEPAWMMATPGGDDGDYLVHVVTPGCPSGDTDLLAETTVPRT